MTTPIYTSPFTGTVVQPTDVSYEALSFSVNTPLYWPSIANAELGQTAIARIMDCSANASSLSLALPEADQGTVGTDVLIRNTGNVAFTVTNFGGGNSTTVNAGISQYFYLTDNSSANGVWGTITFGAGMSAASASSLAGFGLSTTVNGLLTTSDNIVQVSINTTLTNNSRASTYVWTAGAGTFTLPSYASITPGWYANFRNNGTGSLTILPNSPSTINGVSNIVTNPGDSGMIIFDANSNNFFTVGWTSPTNITLSAASYDVDSISGNAYSLVASAPMIQTYVNLANTRTSTLTITLPNITQFYVLINDTTTTSYNLKFAISGSSSPNITLTPGQVVSLVTDGGVFFIITQSTVSSLFAPNGSAAVPSFSFINDTATGLYLAGTSILGITANGSQIMLLNNTNTLNPQISTPATITANNISVTGTFSVNSLSTTANASIGGNLAVTGNSTITGSLTAVGGITGGVF